MQSFMRAIRFDEPGKMNLIDIPDPEPAAGWARIQVRAAAICMTDVETLRGRHPVEFPIIPGHEFCGVADRVGSTEDEAWLGKRVVADNELCCLKCGYCRRGEWRRCKEFRHLGFGPPGGYAEYVVAPVHNLHPLAETVSFEQGSILEPLGVGMAVANIAEVRVGSTVAIIGLGPIGLNCLTVLKAAGVRRILCLDKQSRRLALAKSWGALEVTSDAEQFKALCQKLHPGGADIVVEATGNSPLIPLAISLTRFGGSVVLAGFCKHELQPLEPDAIQGSNRRVLGAGNNPGYIEPAALAAGDGVLRTEGMITHRFHLEDYRQAFSDEQLSASDFIKGIFVF
jgi:threonine dehydrogenase-like Zn-dependent dehydrogenase